MKLSSARKTRACSREENRALIEISRDLFATTITNTPKKKPRPLKSLACVYMTAHAPWSAAATAFAGGDDEAETEVQEDPTVLRLRLARALPPVTGIM